MYVPNSMGSCGGTGSTADEHLCQFSPNAAAAKDNFHLHTFRLCATVNQLRNKKTTVAVQTPEHISGTLFETELEKKMELIIIIIIIKRNASKLSERDVQNKSRLFHSFKKILTGLIKH